MIMNSLKRNVPNIVMFRLVDFMLVKDWQEIINKHEIPEALDLACKEHCICNTIIDEIPDEIL